MGFLYNHDGFGFCCKSIRRVLIRCGILAFCLCTFVEPAYPQGTWQRVPGTASIETAYFAEQTPDGGYIYSGARNKGPSNRFNLAKTDPNGVITWSKTYGSNGGEAAYAAHNLSASPGYIMAGYTSGLGAGSSEMMLVKTDLSGVKIWSKTYGGTGSEVTYGVAEMPDGGYVFGGSTTTPPAAGMDAVIVRTNANGTVQWSARFGNASNDAVYEVIPTYDGGVIATGFTTMGGLGSTNAFLTKFDDTGNLQWGRVYGGSNADNGVSLIETADSGYVILGQTYTWGAGNGDIYVIKTDSLGNHQWSNVFGGALAENAFRCDAVHQTTDLGYVLVGYTQSFGAGGWDGYLLRLDENGQHLWSTAIGGTDTDFFRSVRQTADGGYVLGGDTRSFGPGVPTLTNIYFVKTDGAGMTACNNSPAATVVTLPATASNVLSPVISSGIVETTVNAQESSASETENNECVVLAEVSEDGIVQDGQLSRTADARVVQPGIAEADAIDLFPNPAEDEVFLRFPSDWEGIIGLELFDGQGKRLLQNPNWAAGDAGIQQLDISDLPDGIYHLAIRHRGAVHFHKLLVQP